MLNLNGIESSLDEKNKSTLVTKQGLSIKNDCDKCVICFESIIDSSLNNDLFICSHAKNFHYDCVKILNKCPICRAEFNRNSSDYIIVNEPGYDSCFKYFLAGALCGGFMLWLLFLMISKVSPT